MKVSEDFLCKSRLSSFEWTLSNSSGLIPRWLLEIATIIISNTIIHLLKSQLPSQNEMIPMYEYMAAVRKPIERKIFSASLFRL